MAQLKGRRSSNVEDRRFEPEGDRELGEALVRGGDPAGPGRRRARHPYFVESVKRAVERMRGKDAGGP